VFLSRTQVPGTFVLATDNAFGAIDEIWQDVPCPNGPHGSGSATSRSAHRSFFVPTRSSKASDFVLSGWPVFKNGFENGSLVGWSGTESQ